MCIERWSLDSRRPLVGVSKDKLGLVQEFKWLGRSENMQKALGHGVFSCILTPFEPCVAHVSSKEALK